MTNQHLSIKKNHLVSFNNHLLIHLFIFKEYEKARRENEEKLRKQIELTEQEMESMKRSYEQKLAETLAKVLNRSNRESFKR